MTAKMCQIASISDNVCHLGGNVALARLLSRSPNLGLRTSWLGAARLAYLRDARDHAAGTQPGAAGFTIRHCLIDPIAFDRRFVPAEPVAGSFRGGHHSVHDGWPFA